MFKLAKELAHQAHSGQKRKYTDEDYIVHPLEVAAILDYEDLGQETVISGLLHDVVEDTHISIGTIHQLFGLSVADTVTSVTNLPFKKEFVSAKVRHEVELQRIRCASTAAMNVRCADIISNCRDIWEVAPKYAPIYTERKVEILLAISNFIDKGLKEIAWEVVVRKREKML